MVRDVIRVLRRAGGGGPFELFDNPAAETHLEPSGRRAYLMGKRVHGGAGDSSGLGGGGECRWGVPKWQWGEGEGWVGGWGVGGGQLRNQWQVNDESGVGPLESTFFIFVHPRRAAEGGARELPLQGDGNALRHH